MGPLLVTGDFLLSQEGRVFASPPRGFGLRPLGRPASTAGAVTPGGTEASLGGLPVSHTRPTCSRPPPLPRLLLCLAAPHSPPMTPWLLRDRLSPRIQRSLLCDTLLAPLPPHALPTP